MLETTKQDLREKTLTLLRKQEEQERLDKSLIIESKLFVLQEFLSAKTILFYASFDGEVNTFEMIKRALAEGKTIALPKINKANNTFEAVSIKSLEDCVDGPHGIKQPKSTIENTLKAQQLDAVIVPGIAFDRDNYRLGRGGGFYDRFLKGLSDNISSIGLAFDFQMIDSLPERKKHDIPVKTVLTN